MATRKQDKCIQCLSRPVWQHSKSLCRTCHYAKAKKVIEAKLFRGPEPTRSIVRTSYDQRLVAVMCPYENCGETFPLKKKGDWGSYNIGGYSRHLEEVHNFHRPRPVEVWGF